TTKPGQAVTVTARISSPHRLRAVTLQLQIVEPGSYLSKNDSAYKANWFSLAMHFDGMNGDTRAGDGIFTALVPDSFQRHRRLMRYRLTAVDERSITVRVPYGDDDCPNFAWFVYDGVPSWTGARRPGRTPPTSFSS